MLAERDRLKQTIEAQAPQPAQVMGLKTAYASVSLSTTQKSWLNTFIEAAFSKSLSFPGMFRWLPLFGTPGIQWE